MSSYSVLQLEELELKRVTQKATVKDEEKTENDKAGSTETKVESVKPPPLFLKKDKEVEEGNLL